MTVSRCSARSRARSSADGTGAPMTMVTGRATSTPATTSRIPRSPSPRTHRFTLSADGTSSLVSSSRIPPSSFAVSGMRPAIAIWSITSMQPPHVGPSTVRAGPAHFHGSVAWRSPDSVSARGSVQSIPKSSDSPGSVISSSPPSMSAARSERRCTSSMPGPAPRCTWVDPP